LVSYLSQPVSKKAAPGFCAATGGEARTAGAAQMQGAAAKFQK